MLIAAILLLAATLAVFGYVSWRRAGFRLNPDIWELRDDMDGLLKRESTRIARERASHRRSAERDSEADSVGSDPGPVSSLGGVVRAQAASAPPFAGRVRRA